MGNLRFESLLGSTTRPDSRNAGRAQSCCSNSEGSEAEVRPHRMRLRHSLLVAEADVRWLVLDAFRWVDGHADIWRLFRDADVLATVVEHLAGVAASASATKIAGIESRGFILGG